MYRIYFSEMVGARAELSYLEARGQGANIDQGCIVVAAAEMGEHIGGVANAIYQVSRGQRVARIPLSLVLAIVED